MKHKILSAAALLFTVLSAHAQDMSLDRVVGSANEALPYALVGNVSSRATLDLCGEWAYIVDPCLSGYMSYRNKPKSDRSSYFGDRNFNANPAKLSEYDFTRSETLKVPGDWNSQKAEMFYYEGTVWYRRTFDYAPKAGVRTFLYFGAVNYKAIVGLNGKKIGRHTGGFTPFNFEVTDKLREGENVVTTMVTNNRTDDSVPSFNFDWWNYGGITREVCLIEVPEVFIRNYSVQLAKDSFDTVKGWVQLDGGSGCVTVDIPELKISHKVSTDKNGYGEFEFKIKSKKLQLWCPENPKLYDIRLSSDMDSVSDRIGLRCIQVRGREILLNGKPVFCKGVNIHEEKAFENGGRAWSKEHAATLLGWAKEMGCNFVRLAHYPHNEHTMRLCDEMGIMVWDEIPVYWLMQWKNPDTYANAETQLSEMIVRDHNRASIIIWSVSNETPPAEDGRLEFVSALARKARELDPTRLISSAMERTKIDESHTTVKDPLIEAVDVVGLNEYVGWFDGRWDKCDNAEWFFDFEKPVLISEFGAGAPHGRRGSSDHYYTEDYMMEFYRHQIAMFKRTPGIVGTCPWILKDFRSPRRNLAGIQEKFACTGLVSDKGEKKGAFYIMKEWYDSIK